MGRIGAGIAALWALAVWASACGSAHQPETDDGGDVSDAPGGEDGDADADAVGEDADDGGGCEAGLTLCGTSCVDTDEDPANCGRCGTGCPAGLHATGACVGGDCALACEPGWVDLDEAAGCDYECTPATPSTEACNAEDDDCDGETDETFDCVSGATGSCVTGCGTPGSRICSAACEWVCVPPTEVCDGVDQDCNGVADEGPYGVVWDVVAVEPAGERGIVSFSPAVQGDTIGIGYVLASAAGSVLGQPKTQPFSLADGSSGGRVPANLATESVAQAVRSAGSAEAASYFWTTGDDTVGGSELGVLRSVVLSPVLSLGTAGVVDSSSTVSTGPAVARLETTDRAVVSWLELSGSGTGSIKLAVLSDHALPGLDAEFTMSGSVQPATPDLAIVADTTLLVVWSAFSPPDVSARRFDLTLAPLGEEFLVSTTLGASTVPRVAASGTSFLVAWQEEGEGVMLAAVDAADGTVDVVAEPLAGGTALRPTLAADLAGGFAVAYETDTGVEVQRVSAAGIPAGAPLAFAGGTRPEITTIPEGGLVLAYDHAGIIHLARLGCSP